MANITDKKDDEGFPHISIHGDIRWFNKEDRLHRINGPAYDNWYGEQEWYRHGIWICNDEDPLNES